MTAEKWLEQYRAAVVSQLPEFKRGEVLTDEIVTSYMKQFPDDPLAASQEAIYWYEQNLYRPE